MTTLVSFLLDRSGSMESCRDTAVAAMNGFIDPLRAQKDILFSLVTFDSSGIEKVYSLVPIEDVKAFTRENLVPRGGTPLVDAAYKLIKAVEKEVKDRLDTPKVVICFQTDGQENESCEHTWADLAALVKDKIGEGWELNFMGVELASYKQAAKMGINANNTMSMNMGDAADTYQKFAASGTNTAEYAAGTRRDTVFTMKQRTGDDAQLYQQATSQPAAPTVTVPLYVPQMPPPNPPAHIVTPRVNRQVIPDFNLKD